MKNTIIITALAVLGMTQSVAQEYEYEPFVREGVKWVYTHGYDDYLYPPIPGLPDGVHFATLEIKGDTIINGKAYKAMHKYHGTAIDEQNDTVPVYLREEDKVVYGIVPDGVVYPDCPIDYGTTYSHPIYNAVRAGEEFVLYDFNDPKGYYEGVIGFHDYPGYEDTFSYLYSDTILIGGKKRRCHIFRLNLGTMALIEGIGYESRQRGYPLYYMPIGMMSDPVFSLTHLIENGDTIYESINQWAQNQDYDCLDLYNGHVQWINERVIVQNGDTTSYYYIYKYKSNWGDQQDDVFYMSTEDEQNTTTDSVIATTAFCFFSSPLHRFKVNKALESVKEQGRNMLDFPQQTRGGYYMYMSLPKTDFYANTRNYFMTCQKEPFMTTENFIEVEPLTIEGVSCCRYAYIGEDGDTLAYVVEGIGFDSRDMGDLLTPFTRKPDPTADHQEWCGLSHVVKDGQIIYKGMRYREGVHVGVDEVVADRSARPLDPNYYNLMGQPVGKDVPSTPGIYIHQGKKIVVR